MSREEILEEYVSPFEQGKEYRFNIISIGEPVDTAKSHYREWKFETIIDGEIQEVKMNIFPWQAIPIAEAVGLKKINGKVKVDYDEIEGKAVLATVIFETYKNKNGEDRKSSKLMGFKPSGDEETIPF